MKVQLIAPSSETTGNVGGAGKYPSGALLALASYLKYFLPMIELEILDGEVIDLDQIIKKLDADIIGISSLTSNYVSALEIAEAGQKIGAKVFLGGIHASTMFMEILNSRNCFDGLIVGEGEKALLAICQGQIPTENFVFKTGKKIIQTPFVQYHINELYPFGRWLHEIIDYSTHWANWQKEPLLSDTQHPANIISQKGCSWREKTGGCVFCSIRENSHYARTPESFWNEILWLENNLDVDFVRDSSDCFTSNIQWLKAVRATKPTLIKSALWVHARSNEINDRVASILSQIGVKVVGIGIESGSKDILRNSNKGTTPEQNLRAAKILHDYNILMRPTIVLGLPGENCQSLDSTLYLCEEFRDLGTKEIIVSPLVPFPGSPAYEMLCEKITINSDVVDLIDLSEEWVKYFCRVDYKTILKYQKHILDLFPIKGKII